MAVAKARGGGAKARPAQRAGLGPAARAPRWGRATTLAILASLIILAVETGFTAIRMRETPGVSPSVLFTPMVFAAILAVLLVIQALRADGDARALAESEERFRLAVEAARCGIWEWDLAAGELYMSDITGVMLGWGGGGVAPTEQVLERVAPEHRDRVRQAIAAAMAHGAFDVSFRVARPERRGLDRRARPGGRRGRTGGFSRLVGVALDVTEERIAQVRAQAAEVRLQGAIESVPEGFVLWDRQERLVLLQPELPALLRAGAASAEARRAAASGGAADARRLSSERAARPAGRRGAARSSSRTGAGSPSPSGAPPTAATSSPASTSPR